MVRMLDQGVAAVGLCVLDLVKGMGKPDIQAKCWRVLLITLYDMYYEHYKHKMINLCMESHMEGQ